MRPSPMTRRATLSTSFPDYYALTRDVYGQVTPSSTVLRNPQIRDC